MRKLFFDSVFCKGCDSYVKIHWIKFVDPLLQRNPPVLLVLIETPDKGIHLYGIWMRSLHRHDTAQML